MALTNEKKPNIASRAFQSVAGKVEGAAQRMAAKIESKVGGSALAAQVPSTTKSRFAPQASSKQMPSAQTTAIAINITANAPRKSPLSRGHQQNLAISVQITSSSLQSQTKGLKSPLGNAVSRLPVIKQALAVKRELGGALRSAAAGVATSAIAGVVKKMDGP